MKPTTAIATRQYVYSFTTTDSMSFTLWSPDWSVIHTFVVHATFMFKQRGKLLGLFISGSRHWSVWLHVKSERFPFFPFPFFPGPEVFPFFPFPFIPFPFFRFLFSVSFLSYTQFVSTFLSWQRVYNVILVWLRLQFHACRTTSLLYCNAAMVSAGLPFEATIPISIAYMYVPCCMPMPCINLSCVLCAF